MTGAAPAPGAAGAHRAALRPLAAVLPLLLLFAGGPSASGSSGTDRFFPVEEIRAGLRGTAHTVFQGNEVEEIGVEFLGVLRNAIGPRQHMILARLHGENIDYTGVIAGMSGSPVYVDGRLVGAVSYRIGQFAKEPIAGITPIADMLSLMDQPPQRAAGTPSPDLLGRFLSGADGPAAPQPQGGAADIRPIATPLVCAGCDPEVLHYYAPIFESRGLEPAAGGSVAEIDDPMPPLRPGSPIGAALATGDVSLAAIGTLTYLDGNRVFAFGHPFLGVGSLQIPMTQAQVLLTFASQAGSFRIANTTRPIGTLIEDRLTAIVGEVGRMPSTLPVRVRIDSGGTAREFKYEIARDRAWTPVALALTTANSLVRTAEFNPRASLDLKFRVDIEGFPAVVVEDLYAGTNPGQPVHLAAANEVSGLFSLLYNNSFQELPIRGVEADVRVLEESQVARLSSLRVSRTELRPGESFTVTAGLTTFRGSVRPISFDIRLPEDTPAGQVQILVGGGGMINLMDRAVRQRQMAQAGNIRDLLRLVGRQRKSRTLYLRVVRRSPSAIIRSEILPDLPLSVFTVFNNPRQSEDTTLMLQAPIMELSRDLEQVVVGGRRISIRVQ